MATASSARRSKKRAPAETAAKDAAGEIKEKSKQLQIDWSAVVADKQHKVSQAVKEYQTPARLKAAQKRRPCGEIAAERMRQYFLDMGRELGYSQWMAAVARDCGMNPSSVRGILHGKHRSVTSRLVDQIALATGCPISVFYDPEF